MFDEYLPEPPVESLVRRLLRFAIGGAIAGLIGAPFSILFNWTLLALDRPVAVADFLGSLCDEAFWSYFLERLESVAGAPLGGVLIGVLIGVFVRKPQSARQVLTVSTCTGSIYALIISISTVVEFLNHGTSRMMLAIPLFFVAGAYIGGSIPFFAGVADRLLPGTKPHSPAETTSQAEPHEDPATNHGLRTTDH